MANQGIHSFGAYEMSSDAVKSPFVVNNVWCQEDLLTPTNFETGAGWSPTDVWQDSTFGARQVVEPAWVSPSPKRRAERVLKGTPLSPGGAFRPSWGRFALYSTDLIARDQRVMPVVPRYTVPAAGGQPYDFVVDTVNRRFAPPMDWTEVLPTDLGDRWYGTFSRQEMFGQSFGMVPEYDHTRNEGSTWGMVGQAWAGTLDYMTIEVASVSERARTMALQCSGQKPAQFGGVKLNNFGAGTAMCDSIMDQFCAKTSLSSGVDADLERACSCLSQRAAMTALFAGLDLPVQCFAAGCTTAERGVYLAREQMRGCDAQLCIQTFRVHGSAIAAQGVQTMVCDSVVYDTQLAAPTAGTLPARTSIPDIKPPGIALGQQFWGALAAMGVLVLLVVMWILRRLVMSRAESSAKSDRIVAEAEATRQR